MVKGKMKAVVKHTRGYGARLELADIPETRKDEVLVQVRAASICGTDVHIYTWDDWAAKRVVPPYVFGHEFAGIIVETGSEVKGLVPGDYVSAETHLVCGRCRQCRAGKFHICSRTKIIGVDTQGCFAEYIAVPAWNVWKNPADMPVETASIQEPMGNAVHTVLAGEIAGKTAAIIGCGPIGLLAVAAARAAGASKVLALDVNEYRLNLAAKMGAHEIIHSGRIEPVEAVKKAAGGYGADVVCEMSGNPKAVQQAFKMAANGGRVSILSLPARPVEIDITDDIVFKGLTVQGITGRQVFTTWQQVSGMLASGQVDVTPLLTHQFSIDEFEKGFDLMIQGQCGKVILKP